MPFAPRPHTSPKRPEGSGVVMRVLGIDPGSRMTGYGVVERTRAGIRYVECGVIMPPARLSLAERLVEIASELRALIDELRPSIAAVESVFHAHFARSALVLGHARGVALLAAAEAKLRVFEYPPAMVKRAMVGSGRATKQDVTAMVRAACGLRKSPSVDAADALAVALCHLYRGAK